MAKPKVTVGIPVRNGEKFMRRALASLVSQSYSDIEIIISDNNSTDDTFRICSDIAETDSRIRVHRHLQNIGATNNFQYVLDSAEGEYFMWAAHDDLWHPEFIEKLVESLDKDSNCVVAFCGFEHVDTGGETICTYPHVQKLSYNTESKLKLSSLQKYVLQDFRKGKVNLIYGLYRTAQLQAADAIKKWSATGWGADILIVAEVLRHGEITVIPNCLWKKTQNPNGEGSALDRKKSERPTQMLKGAFETWKKYNKYALCAIVLAYENPINRPRRAAINLFCAFINLIKINSHFVENCIESCLRRMYPRDQIM
jgi:glycosyltransferase involved in cell wall biosynthesis